MNAITEPGQYLTFRLGAELFAINVSQVREVLDLSHVTKVPTAPAYMRGVVNVRGNAIPVVDLRQKFGLPATADTVNTRIVVLELMLGSELCVLGGLADSVHEVIELEPSQINPPPTLAMRWRSEFIQGMGKRGDQFIILLDINAVFSSDDILLVQDTAAAAKPAAA
ncbi:chemotaxis protein CheW [Opitutaceae bacterium EW11]|nr:chemotaxis protein CheW [Opitutaceae bacterium EW11]